MGTNLQRNRQAYSQPLFGRGSGGGVSLREAASPGVSLRSPYAACPRRFCQPPWTHTTSKKSRPSCMGANLQRNRQVYSQPLFGRGPGEALLIEKRPPPEFPCVPSMLHVRGGSVSRRGLILLARNLARLAWGRTSKRTDKLIPSHSSGRGPGEALLLEKRPPPEIFPFTSVP